jgi:hypothetical protein
MSTDNSIQLPPAVKDETGNVYGKLTVLGYAGSKLKALPGAYWNCRCECGSQHIVAGRALRNGTILSCGCSKQRTDEVGNKYGKLTVIEFTGNTKSGDSRWKCLCECGNETTVARGELRRGSTKSCGCHRASAKGMCESPEYTSWQEMKRRCYNPKAPYYEIYGGRGITVCQRWLDAFVNFLDDMGPKPFAEATIDRIDGNSGYEKDNCRWATKLEQSQNSRKVRMITYNGETRCLRDWARKLGITHSTLRSRLERWTLEKSMTPSLVVQANNHSASTTS